MLLIFLRFYAALTFQFVAYAILRHFYVAGHAYAILAPYLAAALRCCRHAFVATCRYAIRLRYNIFAYASDAGASLLAPAHAVERGDADAAIIIYYATPPCRLSLIIRDAATPSRRHAYISYAT